MASAVAVGLDKTASKASMRSSVTVILQPMASSLLMRPPKILFKSWRVIRRSSGVKGVLQFLRLVRCRWPYVCCRSSCNLQSVSIMRMSGLKKVHTTTVVCELLMERIHDHGGHTVVLYGLIGMFYLFRVVLSCGGSLDCKTDE